MEQVLRSLVAKLQAHNEEVMENEANYKALESPIQGPDRSRLTLFVESDHCALLMELFRAVLEAQKCGIEGGSDSDSLIDCLTKAFKLFCQMAELVIKSPSHLLKNREELFEKLVSIIEVIINILPIKITVFPRIVSILHYFPPLNSLRCQNLLLFNSFLHKMRQLFKFCMLTKKQEDNTFLP